MMSIKWKQLVTHIWWRQVIEIRTFPTVYEVYTFHTWSLQDCRSKMEINMSPKSQQWHWTFWMQPRAFVFQEGFYLLFF